MPVTAARGVLPLLAVSTVVVLTVAGLAQGIWPANLHNGLLGLAFTLVGAYVLSQRPGHREGVLLVATGVVEAVMFCGRQIGHDSATAQWWGWVGVWPLAIAIGLTCLSIVCFPDGRLPSPAWRWVAGVVVAVACVCSLMSALWPVEHASAGLLAPFPLALPEPGFVEPLWNGLAHPAYAAFQLIPVVAVVHRWRISGGTVRSQLSWLIAAALVSAVALVAGLAVWQSPRAGIWAATILPIAAGWAILHGRHLASYRALSWLSRAGGEDHPTALVRATADALSAPGAKLWMGSEERLQAVGVWPSEAEYGEPTSLALLRASPEHHARAVHRGDAVIGALSVTRAAADRLSITEAALLDDLAAQAALVIEHLSLAELVSRQQVAGHLEGLSPREREVLDLMAKGLSNAAICGELHLSIKTIEPVVGSIFTKLGLHADSQTNRRVLAVLAYLRT